MTEPVYANANSPNADRKPDARADVSIQQVSPALAKPETPIPKPECCKSKKTKRDCFDYSKGILEVVGLIILCIYACYTVGIYHANQRAADAAEKQIRLSVRPWVGVADEVDAFTADHFGFSTDGVANVGYTLIMKNFGNVPAQNAMAYGQLVVSMDIDRINNEQEKVCNSIGHAGGYIIFSGKQGVVDRRLSFWSPNDIVLDPVSHKTMAVIVGCVGYRDQFGCLYTTRFVYQLRDSHQPGVPVLLEPRNGAEIPGHWVLHYSGSAVDAGVCQTQE
ncbi:MAG TPA: hypothetical protein VNW97_17825 [Candidatus Saccharimonadales bacterium]|nr:hypothetical protein [Candidatus Saccharimonadales bacterium]